MKSDNVVYESCDYYAYKGNEVAKEFFSSTYSELNISFIEPEDAHSVYDLQMDVEWHGKIIHYYVEVKLKFNKHFFDNFTYITRDKVHEINAFMKDKDKTCNRFLYLNYYPMCGYIVLFDLSKPHDYETSTIVNRNATADKTDIEPYVKKVQMFLLPMKNNDMFQMYNHPSAIEIKYNNHIWKEAKMIS